MEKKGILPLLGLLILFAAACATTGSGNVPSASVAAIGTPEAIATLLGKWSGTWEVEASFSAGLRTIDCSMVIKKVDLDQKIIDLNLNYSWVRGTENEDVRADYIPPDRFKFRTKDHIYFDFKLKNGILRGASQGSPFPGFLWDYPGIIKMTKIRE